MHRSNKQSGKRRERKESILKWTLVTFVAVFIGFACVANALAQTVPAKGQNEARKRLSGTVVAVDATSKTLIVKNWRGQTTFDIADAKVVRRANMEDIRPGDRVIMSYVEEGGRKTAKVLIATPATLEEGKETEALKGPSRLKDGSVQQRSLR